MRKGFITIVGAFLQLCTHLCAVIAMVGVPFDGHRCNLFTSKYLFKRVLYRRCPCPRGSSDRYDRMLSAHLIALPTK